MKEQHKIHPHFLRQLRWEDDDNRHKNSDPYLQEWRSRGRIDFYTPFTLNKRLEKWKRS